MTLPAGPPPLRIGDAQRRAVDVRLQAAVGDGVLTLAEYDDRARDLWAARTQAELDALVADLPAAADPVPVHAGVAAAPPPGVPGRLGRPKPRWGVAVFGEHTTAGPVAVRQKTNAVSVFGSTTVDLRRTDLPPVVEVQASAVFGQTTVLVPVGARVESNGVSVFGHREERLEPTVSGAPVVRVRGAAVFGSVEVHHGSADERVVAAVRPAPVRRRHRGPARFLLVGALVVGVAAGGSAVVLQRTDDSAVFGSSVHHVTSGTSSVDVGVLFGSVKVVIPDGEVAQVGGRVVFGSSEDDTHAGAPAGAPVVRVHAAGGFGSVEVMTEAQYTADQADDGDDD